MTQLYLESVDSRIPPQIVAGQTNLPERNQNTRNKINLDPFLDSEYRDEYLDTYVKSSIAHQIRSLREQSGLTQVQFARKLGTAQSIVSRLESAEYGSVTVSTLLKIAKRNDVALEVVFTDYPTMLSRDVGCEAMKVNTIFDSYVQQSQAQARITITPVNTINNPMILLALTRPESAPVNGTNQGRHHG
jgi:transcriptional regulator with XRE-family HTH domain